MLDTRWTIEATAKRFQVDLKTVRKYRSRLWRDTLEATGVVHDNVPEERS